MPDRNALLRQWTVLRCLSARRHGVSVEEMAGDAGVCTKTIRRDVAFLQQLGFPIVDQIGEHGRKRWRIDAVEGLLNLQFTLEEAAALSLGRQFLEPLTGTYFHAGAQSAFAKIRATLGDAALKHLEHLAAGFYHSARGWCDYSRKAQLIDDLVRAIEDRRMTAIVYRSLASTEPVGQYDLYPLSLIYWRGALYLIADSPRHGAVRTFKVDRISEVQVLQLQFPQPINFDPSHFLAHSFGIFQKEGEPVRIRVAFRAEVARILEERQFHSSQRLTRRRDGRILAEFRLSAFEDFVSWILSFGPLAEVLEPPELQAEVASRHRDAAALYSEETSQKTRSSPGSNPRRMGR